MGSKVGVGARLGQDLGWRIRLQGFSGTLGGASRRSQMPPDAPNTGPRRFQDAQDAPRRPQDVPKTPQDAPRHPRTPQDTPKTPEGAPKTLPRRMFFSSFFRCFLNRILFDLGSISLANLPPQTGQNPPEIVPKIDCFFDPF